MIKIIFSGLLILPFIGSGQVKVPIKTKLSKVNPAVQSSPLKSSLDSFSYAIGLNVATNIKEQGITEVNSTLVLRAFNDVYKGNTSIIDMQTANNIVQQKFESIASKKADAEKLVSLKFLNENKKRPEVKTTISGLQYEIFKVGTGVIPVDTSTVKVYYTVYLLNGQTIDSSNKKGPPVQVRVNEIITGWAEALKLMPVGSKWRLYIPFYLAFGDQGAKPLIPPGANLIYDVELVEIVGSPRKS